MNNLIKPIGILLLTLTCSLAYAQEECNNGQDDDGDGQVDCTDGDCQFAADIEKGCNCDDNIDNDGDGQADEVDADCAGFYGLSFVGETASECSIQPDPSDGTFDFVDPSYSGQNTVDTQSRIAVGDMNCDGIPDVVTTSKWNQNLRVIATSENQPDGSDKGDVIQSFKTTGSKIFPKGNFFFELEVLIADIDGSCPAEIFSIVSNRKNADSEPTQYYLVGFRANSSPSNSDLVPLFDAVPLGPDRPGEITIADMDCDQSPEIILKDQVFDAATGALLADGNAGDWNTEVTSAPVAIDIIEGGNLEIVSGNKILSYPDMTVIADMNSLGGDQWFPKEIFDANEYGFDNFSSTSVADMNNDGNLDVVLSGALDSKNGKTSIFFWDVTNGTVESIFLDDPDYADGWIWGSSRPNLGDIDGDGQLEITVIAGSQLFALEVDPTTGALIEKWRRTINDSRSGVVSTTVYDFDNDGSPEIVYRDSQQLVVVDGETGQEVLWSVSCQSHTMTEGPVIADVDGDGATDICTTCNTNNSFDIEAGIQQQALGELRCFFSQNNNWLPTRGVWNQSGYYVTNIADDLSVPCPRFDMTTEFSDSPCSNGVPGPQTPLNTFMNQVPTLAADGCPYYPAPDISFIGDDPNTADPNDPDYFPAVNFMPPVCGDLGVGVSFNFINSGGMTISTQVPVSFWEGNPTVEVDPNTGEPANFLHLDYINLTNLQVGDTVTTDTTNFDYSGRPTTLYIVLNDDGTTFPVDTTSNDGKDFQECNLDNNIYAFEIMPEPFSVEIEHISDNFKCDNDSPNNGELRGVVMREGVEVTDYSPYAFQWYYGSDTTNQVPDPDGKEPSLTALDEGIYSLVVTNSNKGCSSLPVQDTVVRRGVDPTITILINSDQTYCYPPNGELEVTIEGGISGYTFEWYDNNLSPLGITGPVAGDLTEGEWIVDVTKDGCTKRASQTINGPTEPDVVASVTQHIVDCADLNSGEVTADPFINGIAQNPADYEFDWYFYDNATGTLGSILPPENGTGPTRIDLPEGYYAVVATEIISGCESAPPQVVQVLDQTVYPTLVINEIAPQTSCDPDNPNGILEVEISMGGTVDSPSNYTIEWFRGDNTLPENLHTTTSGVNGERALEIEGGGVPYTVKVTTANNCFTTASYIITEDTVVPVVTLSKIDNSICDPSLASSEYNGQVTAAVSFRGTNVTLPDAGYEFTWYDGNSVSSPVIPVADNTAPSISQLDAGFYTVEVTKTDVYCTSVAVTIEVVDASVDPTATIVEDIQQTSCDPSAPNAQITASAATGGTVSANGYTYAWFTGTGTGTAFVDGTDGTISGTDGETISGIAARTYTVQVTDRGNGCQSITSYTVADNTQNPVVIIGAADITANTICNPALTNPVVVYNGAINASNATYNSAAVTLSDYRYDWYKGSSVKSSPDSTGQGGSGGEILSNLSSGFYTVTITRTVPGEGFGCTSDPVTVEVPDASVDPTVNIVEDIPLSSCDPDNPNAQITADALTGGSASAEGYVYKWFVGSGTVLPFLDGTHGTGGNTKTISGIAANTYTVLVTDNATGCQNTASFDVLDKTQNPVVIIGAADITANTVCDPALTDPAITNNGAIDASNATYDGTAVNLSDYRYDWYYGTTVKASPDSTAQGGSGGELLSNLAPGFYTVTITRTVPGAGFGCTSDPVTREVPDASVVPTATIVEDIQQTSCDPSAPNAQLTASAQTGGTPSLAGYTYEWFTGSGTGTAFVDGTDGTISGTDGETISGIAAGTYTVQATDKGNGCQVITNYTVADNTQNPVVTIDAADITANTVCDPALTDPAITNNGAIDASDASYNGAAVTLSDYRYDWYVGSAVKASPDFTGQGGSGGEVWNNLAPGFYTVTITRTVPGEGFACTSDPLTVEVPDASVDPTATIVEDIQQTSCDPAAPNAQLTASAQTGGLPSLAGYTYDWFTGSGTGTAFVDGTDGTISGADGETISGIAAGTYTVQVTDKGNGCQVITNYTVVDNTQNPIVTIDAADITANTICDPSLTDPAVTNNGAIDASDASYNGAAVTLSDYRYDWYVGSAVKASPDFTGQGGSGGEVWNNLAPGFYTVTITRTVPGEGFACTSDPVTVEVPDASVVPTATIVEDIQQTSCDPAAPNAQLTASAQTGGTPSLAGYTYEWFTGSGTGTAFVDGTDGTISGTDGETISGIAARTYTVQVTDKGNGCQVITNYTVVDNTQNPILTIDSTDITANTICDPALTNPAVDYDGAIDASNATYNGVAINPPDYRYDWYVGNAVKATADFSAQGGSGGEQWTNLAPGEYTVTITRTVAGEGFGCTSDPVTREVPDASVTPTPSITIDQQQTSCDPANPSGQLTASALTGGSASSYAYDWYIGSGTGTPFVEGTDGVTSGAAGETISNLASRTYTVMVTDLATGCQEIFSKFLPEAISIPEVTLNSMTQNTICNPAQTSPAGDYNGELVVNVSDLGPVTFPNANYEFTWYNGGEATGTPRATVTGNPDLGLLPGGEYTVVVRNITTSCESVPFTVEVTDNLTYPTITTTTENQTSCDPAAPNGEVDAVIGGGSTYDITWFEGGGTGGTVIQSASAASTLAATGLASGNYTVLAVDNATGCSTEKIVYVNEVIVIPEVSLAITTGMTDCTYDGVITPTVDNAASIPAPSGYQFDWYRGTDTSNGIYATTFDDGVNTPELSTANTGLEIYSDFYTVVVTDIDAGCTSEPVTIYLDRPAPLFEIEDIINYRPSFCSAAEGILTAYVDLNNNGSYDAGEADYAQYKFEWYEGVPTDPDANYYTDPEPTFVNPKLDVNASGVYPGSVPASTTSPYFAPDGTDGATIYGYPDGRYTVVITDLSNGCKEFRTLDLPFAGSQQIVNVGITNSTSCANPNGELEITSIEVDGVAQNLNDYTFDWYEGNNEVIGSEIVDGAGTQISGPVLDQISGVPGLPAAYYTVVAVQAYSPFCRATPVTVFVDSAARQPDVVPTLAHNTSCSNSDGSITVTASPDPDDTAPLSGTYSYLWTSANTIQAGEETTPTITQLAPGDYTVTVTDDNSGCFTTETYTILDQPIYPDIVAITATDNTMCTPNENGTLVINDADVTSGDVDDYNFEVYFGGSDAGSLMSPQPATTAGAASISFDNLAPGMYYITAERITPGPGYGCTSIPVQADEVLDSSSDPVLTSVIVADNDCDPNQNGSLEVTADAAAPSAGTYTFEWFVGTNTSTPFVDGTDGTIVPPGAGTENTGSITEVLHGNYTVRITDPVTNCIKVAPFTVPYSPEAPEIDGFDITNQQSCGSMADGAITVTSLTIGIASDYDYEWYASVTDYNNANPLASTTETITGLPEGTYYVVATKKAGSATGEGCPTPLTSVTIENDIQKPEMQLTQTANTACDNSFDGTLTINVSDPAGPGVGALYTYDITFNGGPYLSGQTANDGVNDVYSNLENGTYVVTATNENTTCSVTETISVQYKPQEITFTTMKTDLEYCSPNGNPAPTDAQYANISVSSITPASLTDYTYTWYEGLTNFNNGTAIAAVNGPELNVTNYPAISAGAYYVVANRNPGTNPGSACQSPAVEVIIIDNHVDPVMTLSQTPNTSCDNTYDGTLTIDVSDPSGPGAGQTYTYDINFNGTPLMTGLTGNSGISNIYTDLEDGEYEVTATNEVTTCTVTEVITLQHKPEPITLTTTKNDLEYCSPSGTPAPTDAQYASITVNSITPGTLADYTYTWYEGLSNLNAGAAIPGVTGPDLNVTTYAGITAGKYFVTAQRNSGTNPGSACESPAVEVVIIDNHVDPVLTMSQSPNTSCDNTYDGSLTINVSDPSGPGMGGTYTYDISMGGTMIVSGSTGNSGVNNIIPDLQDGTYEVTATNEITTCSVTEIKTVQHKPEPITFTTTKNDLEYCSPSGTPAPTDAQYASITVNSITPGGLTDYTYTWYEGLTNLNSGTAITGVTGPELNVSNYSGIKAGKYYVTAQRNPGTNPGSNCESSAVEVEIIDNHVDPVMTLSQTANTSCDNTYDGSLTVNVSDPSGPGAGATYTYDISLGGSMIVSGLTGNSGVNDVFPDLQNGTYEVTATNEITTCSVTEVKTVEYKPEPITLTTTKNDLVYCSPSGTPTPTDAEYANISVNSISPGGLADYTYRWYEGLSNLNSDVQIAGVNGPDLNVTNYPGIGAGEYYVIATRNPGTNPGSACESSAVQVVIDDNSVNPEMTLSQTSNTSCDGNFDGSITINVADPSGPGTGATFTYDVDVDGTPYLVDSTGNSGSNDVIGNLKEGTYTVTATNEVTTCVVVKTITIRANPQPIDVVNVTNEDQDICYPDGRIEVEVADPGAITEFNFEWYYDDMTSTPLEDQAGDPITGPILEGGNAAGQYPLMGAGTYYIVARKNANTPPGSNCESAPYRVVVEDLSEDPVLTFNQPDPDITCSGENPTGKIEVTSSQDVAFTWAADIDGDGIFGEAGDDDIPTTATQTPAPGVTGPTSTYDSLPEGNYQVTALNTTSGCAVTGEMAIVRNPKLGEPNILNVEVVNPLDCNGSGTMTVTAVSIGGAPAVTDSTRLANEFKYMWTDADKNPLSASDTTSHVDGLADGQYFVTVVSRKTGCSSIYKEVNILGDDIIYPVIDLQLTIPQIVCDGNVRPFSAELQANVEEADGNVDTYTFEWFYEGASGLPAGASVSETSVSSTASNLPTGRYTVVASNDSSSCTVSDFYIIRDKSERYKPQVSTSSEPLTKCSGPNGSVLVADVEFPADYPYPEDYTVDWYIGDDPDMTAAPDYPATERVSNLPDGLYTIRVTDNNTGCTVSEVQDVRDERVMPVIAVTVDNPQTTCPPYNPNGQLTATADGRVGGYTFEWFEGPEATGSIISNKNRLTGFPAGEYTVRVTNDFTGCITVLTDEITDGRLVPPLPDPELKKNLTSCVDLDGRLAVSVDGVVQGYSFTWYEGTEASGTILSDRSDVIGLDMGMYTVTATDRVSGCVSEGVSIEVGDDRQLPEFEFSTVGSKCDDATGSATIAITNNTVASEVAWTEVESGFSLGLGTDLYDVPAGTYAAEVTTFMGCVSTEQVEIGTVITNYNLVSSDGDGVNDNFQIDCITQFPNNNIKIYNRNGVLVFEMDGYNNADKSFEGVGENGLYSMGDKLPNGTYFYVIDKRDGSEVVSGFLELIR